MPRSCLRGKHVSGEDFEIGSQAGIDPRNPRTYVVEHDVDVVFLDVELYPPEGVVQLVQRLKNDERRRPAADAFVVALQIRRVLLACAVDRQTPYRFSRALRKVLGSQLGEQSRFNDVVA